MPTTKKVGGGLMFFQRVQNGGCAAILVARIEGKVDYFFRVVLGIPGVIYRRSSSKLALAAGGCPSS